MAYIARNIGFDGIRERSHVTFDSALVKHTDEDKLVKLSANGTIVLCAAEDENFIGIVRIIDQHDKRASVQVDGFVTMAYDPGHAPSIGWQALQSGATPFNTWVKLATAAATIPLRLVVAVDTDAETVTFLLNPGA